MTTRRELLPEEANELKQLLEKAKLASEKKLAKRLKEIENEFYHNIAFYEQLEENKRKFDKLLADNKEFLDQFHNSHRGYAITLLMAQPDLKRYGIWKIFDRNYKFLCEVQGTYEQACCHAMTYPTFGAWEGFKYISEQPEPSAFVKLS